MRIITLNANGIRAASRKGFFDWLDQQKADFVCIQETKAQLDQLDQSFSPRGYHTFYHSAEKKGYSGVALYCKAQPDRAHYGIGVEDFDAEGRWLQADFGRFSVVSLYLPSGSSSEARQQVKFEIMDWLMPKLKDMAASGRHWVICGDWNIAHREIDLKNWRSNRKNSGFLPEERAWMTELFDDIGWVDAFRHVEPGADHYTWWSNRGQAWAKNVGWRIDYHVATRELGGRARGVNIFKDVRFSDHAPVTIDYDGDLQDFR